MGVFGKVAKGNVLFTRLAMLLVLALLVFASGVSAYSVQFSKGVKNEHELRQYLADYDQSRLQGVAVVSFTGNLGSVKGLFLIGGLDKNRIMINPASAWNRWHFNALMDHETAHAICWQTRKDVSHTSECFRQESGA
ncbi:hypothetical protein HYY73_05765 [Candidatus Woesearchaeota archaeon]|nr:hypothetical protein [Candidatus Woesearchaeota archaeon]